MPSLESPWHFLWGLWLTESPKMCEESQGTTELILQSRSITECCEPLPDPEGGLSLASCHLLRGQVVNTRLEQIWGGFAVELQQKDLHGAVVTGPFITTRTWASGLTPCCSATSLTPTSIFHAQRIGSHMEVTCVSYDPNFQRPHCVSLIQSLISMKMQGLWNIVLDLKHIFNKGSTLQSKG